MTSYHLPDFIDLLIFDIDGTLYSGGPYAQAQFDVQYLYLAQTRGGTAVEWKNKIDYFRATWAATHDGAKISLGNALLEFGVDIDESIRLRETLLKPEKFLIPDPALHAALTKLKSRYSLSAVTNNPVLIGRKTLKALGVEKLFTTLVGLDSCRVSKPHEAPYRLAAALAGASFTRCVSIGDRYDIDIKLPLSLGMGGILVEGAWDVYALPETLIPDAVDSPSGKSLS